mgnify:CR=1 FL=1
MGDTTYFSLKGYYKDKPLPYGKIYVASISKNLVLNDAIVINDVNTFLENLNEDLWVVGGATIYKLALPYADECITSLMIFFFVLLTFEHSDEPTILIGTIFASDFVASLYAPARKLTISSV